MRQVLQNEWRSSDRDASSAGVNQPVPATMTRCPNARAPCSVIPASLCGVHAHRSRRHRARNPALQPLCAGIRAAADAAGREHQVHDFLRLLHPLLTTCTLTTTTSLSSSCPTPAARASPTRPPPRSRYAADLPRPCSAPRTDAPRSQPDSEKSTTEHIGDKFKGKSDSAASTLEPQGEKSTSQRVGDAVSGNSNQTEVCWLYLGNCSALR